LPFARAVSATYPIDWVPLCTRLKRSAAWLQTRSRCQRALALPRAPRHRACHSPGEGSGVATCPVAQSVPPRQERALVSPRALRHQARHTTGKGSGVATGPEAPSPSPDRRGLQSHHVPCGCRPTPLRRKALALPHDRHTRTTARQGSGIAMCLVAPDLPPGAGGLRSHHVPSGPQPPGVPVRSQDV
jgi:hypothetical protein